jgi:hypothetical protein
MASRGQWKVTRDYPKIKIADELKSYRITANDKNKKCVDILYQRSVYANEIKAELELTNAKKIGDANNSYSVVEYTDTLNPGCSLDIKGRMVQINLTDDDETASGTFEKI